MTLLRAIMMNYHILYLKNPHLCMMCAPFVHDFPLNGAHHNLLNKINFSIIVHGVHDFLACVREMVCFFPRPLSQPLTTFQGQGSNVKNKIHSHKKNIKKWCTPCTYKFNLLFFNKKIVCMILNKWCTYHAHYAHTQFSEWK